MPGYKLQVKYSEKGANIVFQSILVGKSNRMWQIITTAEPDPTYAAMASKALAGVVIKP